MSTLDVFIRPLNIIYCVEGKLYDEVTMLQKLFNLLKYIISTFQQIDDNFTFMMFCEFIENKQITIEFWNELVYRIIKIKDDLKDLHKITSLFEESINSIFTVNPYVLDYFKSLKSKGVAINLVFKSNCEISILKYTMIKLGLKDYISSFVNNSELEKIDKLSFYISFDIEELMNLNKKFFITALSLLILDDSERLDNLKEKNRLYFLDKLFPDFTFEMLLQTNCLIELLISSKDSSKKHILDKFFENKLKVLYIFPKKYKSKFYRKRLVSISNDRIYYIPYFGYNDLSINGSFDIILQRCTKFSDNTLNIMKNFSEKNRHILVIDHFSYLDILFDRFEMSNLISNFIDNCEFKERIKYPKYFKIQSDLINAAFIVETLKKFGIDFPIIIKNVNGNDHGMFLILTNDGLKKFLLDNLTHLNKHIKEYFVQEYINHGGIMIKTYYLNETNKSVIRPSLPNIDESIIAEMPHFKKGYFEFYNEFLYQKQDQTFWERVKINPDLEKELDYNLLDKVSKRFNEFSKISLYGIDFMYDEISRNYYFLEINYFPSYREFGLDLYKFISEHIEKCYKKFKK